MGEFVNLLRKLKIKSPNTFDWNERVWASDFSQITELDTADEVTFNAGLWLGNKLSAYWEEVQTLDLAKYNLSEVQSKITLMVNGMAKNGPKLDSSPVKEYSDDHFLTALGDTLNRGLKYINSLATHGQEPVSDSVLERSLNLFNGIYVLEFLWDRVLWGGWGTAEIASDILLTPITTDDDQLLQHEAVAEFLRQIDAQQIWMLIANEWDAGRHREIAPPTIKLLRYQVPRAAFSVELQPVAIMPSYLPHLLSYLPSWLDPMLTKPLAELEGNGLIEVVYAWRLLFDAVATIQNAGEAGLIHLDDATALIAAVRPHLSREIVRTIVDFLVHDPNKNKGDGIWSAPFVRLSQEILCPVVPSLMHPNIQRMVDLWGERCTSEQLLNFRGELWEQHLRDSLIKEFGESFPDQDWWMQSTDLQRWGHQIDVLFRIGRLVVVGETKFAKYPCIPAEFGRFFRQTLDKAAKQCSLRQASLENNRKDVAKFCQYSGDPHDLIIFPLVISPHFLGSGIQIRGIDCVSFDDFLHFFTNDRLPLGALSATGVDAVANLRFRKENEQLDDAFLRYLMRPPQTFFYSHAVEHVQRRYINPQSPETTVRWHEGIVKLPTDTAAFTVFAQRIEGLWNSEVLAQNFT